MKQEELQVIKERCEKATPGPWEWDVDSHGCVELYNTEENEVITAGCGQNVGFVRVEQNDARFIEAARQDIPTLIAEVERLREALEKVTRDEYSYLEIAKIAHQALDGE